MSQNLNPGEGQPAPSYSPDPEVEAMRRRNAELEDYYNRSQGFLEQLSPHQERIKRLLEDETAPRIFDDSIQAYESIQARQKPKLSPEWDPAVNPWLEKIEKIGKIADQFDERTRVYEQQQTQQANDRLLAENSKIAEKLCAEYPTLKENGYAGIEMIAMRAQQRGTSFEEAARQLEPLYKSQSQAVDAPSLRSGAGQQGVPGPSESKKSGDVSARFLEIMNSGTR